MQKLTSEAVKDYGLSQGLDLVGVANIERFAGAPPRMHPSSIMPSARSVIVVARRILRFPRRSATTVAGIALAMGLMVTTQHFPLAMNRIIEVTFEMAHREDVMVSFSEAADDHILDEIARMLGGKGLTSAIESHARELLASASGPQAGQ